MAREVADVKAEQRELRILLGRRKYSAEIDGGGVAENRHTVFENTLRSRLNLSMTSNILRKNY